MFTDIYPSINFRLNNTSSQFFQQMLVVYRNTVRFVYSRVRLTSCTLRIYVYGTVRSHSRVLKEKARFLNGLCASQMRCISFMHYLNLIT